MLDTMRTWFAGLQPRERTLILLMTGTFGLLIAFIAIMELTSSFVEREEEIEAYREALYYLEDHQTYYLEDSAEKEKLSKKLSADFDATNYLFSAASQLGFDAQVTPKEATDVEGQPGLRRQEFNVSINTVDHDIFMEYLWRVKASPGPMFIQMLDMKKVKTSTSGAATPLSASLTVITYMLPLRNPDDEVETTSTP